MPFDVLTYCAADLPDSVLNEIALLTAQAYERDLRADVSGSDTTTTPADLRTRLLLAFRHAPIGQIISVVSVLCGDGERIPVATARIAHSDRALPVGETIGDPTSPLPTHKFWHGFRYPDVPGKFSPTLPESAVGEFTQLAAVDRAWLDPYVAHGVMTAEIADAAARGAAFAAIAAVYRRDQEQPAPPRGYVFDTRAQLAGVLKHRYRLHILPLFHEGVSLRPEILADPLHARTVGRWLAAMAPYVPSDVWACGLDASVRYLAAAGFDDWAQFPMRLPWLLLNDEQTAAGMHRLAGLLPTTDTAQPLVAAD
jgi:hypothetical protein